MADEMSATAITAEQRRVHQASLVRALVVCAAWLATWPFRHSGWKPRDPGRGAGMFGGWWAMLPGRKTGGKIFGEHGHWSSLVVALPIGFGIAAAAELWHLIHGGG